MKKNRVYGNVSLSELEGLLRDKAIEECPYDTDSSICLRAADVVYHYCWSVTRTTKWNTE